MPIDYNNGKIYKIVSNNTNRQYIGSTCQKLNTRLSNHKNMNKLYKNGKTTHCYSFDVIDDGNYKIELIEKYPCKSKKELTNREAYYILKLKCVNKQIPNRTYKQWYDDNSDIIKKKQKQYYQSNKDKWIINRNKNKHKISERKKKLIICECNSTIRKDDIARHLKSKKHINYMNGNWLFNID